MLCKTVLKLGSHRRQQKIICAVLYCTALPQLCTFINIWFTFMPMFMFLICFSVIFFSVAASVVFRTSAINFWKDSSPT